MTTQTDLAALADRIEKLGRANWTYNNRASLAAELRSLAVSLPGDGWVSANDRLPERTGLGSVLAFDANRPSKGVWQEACHPSWWGQFMPACNEWGPTITHWRELPPSPTASPEAGDPPA